MVIVWIAILYCVNTAQCSPNGNTQFFTTFATEEECQQYGLTFLKQSSHAMRDRVIVCVKGVK
jgi:hypothetical protein